MDTGSGLALLGVWIFAASAMFAKEVTGLGLGVALVIAIGLTFYIA